MKTLLIIIVLFFSFSCSENSTDIPDKSTNRIKLSYSSADSLEARDLALWASAQLIPSDSAVTEMLYSINYLRYRFKDSLFFTTLLSARFMPPWDSKSVSIKFDSITAAQIRNNTYTGWSLLPSAVKPDSVRMPNVLGWSLVTFSQCRNPWRITEIYRSLPGVLSCGPNGFTFIGGTFPIFPGMKNNEMTYLFVNDYQLIPGSKHYIFYKNEEPVYAGVWSNQQDPKPTWWQDAKTSMDSFYYWGRYSY